MKKIKAGDILIGFNPYKDSMEEGVITEIVHRTNVLGQYLDVKIFELISKKDGEILTNMDLQNLNAKLTFDTYKKKNGFLTTQEIINIRKKRGWSQEKMAKFLDIGLKDIARYENGAIQTKAIDNMIRLVDNDQIFYAMAKYLNKLSFAE